MKIFMDTSVLIKRYLVEAGSDKVDKLFESASQIIVSPVTAIEARSILRRLLAEKKITRPDYKKLNEELSFDFDYFTVVNFDAVLEVAAKSLIDRYQLKTLDALQLASANFKKSEISLFVASDKKLLAAARDEQFKVVDPSSSD
jgi:predicted nucleic acid-binding protein